MVALDEFIYVLQCDSVLFYVCSHLVFTCLGLLTYCMLLYKAVIIVIVIICIVIMSMLSLGEH